jgi:hypothetical protein
MKLNMKLAIVGSREFNDYEFLKQALEPIKDKVTLVVSGGAKGADSLGERWAKENNIPTQIFYPDWGKFGKSAGFKRNVEIVDNCDAVVAFQINDSKGTQHTINISKEKGKKVKVFKIYN